MQKSFGMKGITTCLGSSLPRNHRWMCSFSLYCSTSSLINPCPHHTACDLKWTFYGFLTDYFQQGGTHSRCFLCPIHLSSTNVDSKSSVPGHHRIANSKNELPTPGFPFRSHVVTSVTIVHRWQVTSGMITVERLTHRTLTTGFPTSNSMQVLDTTSHPKVISKKTRNTPRDIFSWMHSGQIIPHSIHGTNGIFTY